MDSPKSNVHSNADDTHHDPPSLRVSWMAFLFAEGKPTLDRSVVAQALVEFCKATITQGHFSDEGEALAYVERRLRREDRRTHLLSAENQPPGHTPPRTSRWFGFPGPSSPSPDDGGRTFRRHVYMSRDTLPLPLLQRRVLAGSAEDNERLLRAETGWFVENDEQQPHNQNQTPVWPPAFTVRQWIDAASRCLLPDERLDLGTYPFPQRGAPTHLLYAPPAKLKVSRDTAAQPEPPWVLLRLDPFPAVLWTETEPEAAGTVTGSDDESALVRACQNRVDEDASMVGYRLEALVGDRVVVSFLRRQASAATLPTRT